MIFISPRRSQKSEKAIFFQAFQYPTNSLSIVTSGGKKTAQVKDPSVLIRDGLMINGIMLKQ